jgi:alkaline phosphatase D
MRSILYLLSVFLLFCCGNPSEEKVENTIKNSDDDGISADYTLVFASCSDQDRPQPLWQSIVDLQPDLFIWGGDNVYADTDDMAKMKADYEKVRKHPVYSQLAAKTPITGTWDDHDYGKNDAGAEWEKKEEAKTILLDFLGVSEDDERRKREGVYFSEMIQAGKGKIKLISLDTRYFRSPLNNSPDPDKSYEPWPEGHEGTLLGDTQWAWLEEELKDDTADFTLIVSSIQFLSKEHGWEKWYNFPSEVEKMRELLKSAQARNIIFLSGDRHLGEVSVDPEAGLGYPLVDFTSSGMTHTWLTYATEANEYRVSNVVKRLNFGLLLFDFDKKQLTFELRGEDNFIYERFVQQY